MEAWSRDTTKKEENRKSRRRKKNKVGPEYREKGLQRQQ
jgi:hypothetical protein